MADFSKIKLDFIVQQETEKELNSQIKNWGKTLRNEEPVIVEESQKQNWQNFCEQVCDFAITWGEDEWGNSTHKKSYFYNLFHLPKNLILAEHQFCSVLKNLNYNWDWCDLKIKQAGVCESYDSAVLKQAESIASSKKKHPIFFRTRNPFGCLHCRFFQNERF